MFSSVVLVIFTQSDDMKMRSDVGQLPLVKRGGCHRQCCQLVMVAVFRDLVLIRCLLSCYSVNFFMSIVHFYFERL